MQRCTVMNSKKPLLSKITKQRRKKNLLYSLCFPNNDIMNFAYTYFTMNVSRHQKCNT